MTAFQIKKVSDVTEMEILKSGVDILNVQYSDFVSNPEKILAEILDYTGLPQDQACFNYFKKYKIYNQNRADDYYFQPNDLKTIRDIFAYESIN